MRRACLFLLLALCAPPLPAGEDFLMGSVVKSDKWTMNRVDNTELFTGNVSFRNPRYTLKADKALYARAAQTWTMDGHVYMLRRFEDRTLVEVNCENAFYRELQEEAMLSRGALPVRMAYTGADGRVLRGRSDRSLAENLKGLMHFEGSFALSTENIDMFSEKGLYTNADGTFLMYESTPMAVGIRQGYDFAIRAEEIKFFRESRDIKFYNRVAGWVKDVPPPAVKPQP